MTYWQVDAFTRDGRTILSARVSTMTEADALAQSWLGLGMIARCSVRHHTVKTGGL